MYSMVATSATPWSGSFSTKPPRKYPQPTYAGLPRIPAHPRANDGRRVMTRQPDINAPPEIPVSLSLPLEQVLALAEQHLEAGRLPAAEALWRDILPTRPDCAPAPHLLGII